MARFTAMMLLGPSVFAALFLQDFWTNPQKFKDSRSTEQNETGESKVMKERGNTKLSDAILGGHLTVHEGP